MKNFFLGTIILFTLSLNAQVKELYVSDAANFNIGPWKIIKYDENGDNPQTFISQNLNWPQDILFLEDKGEVLITNLGTNNINRFDIETGAYLSAFASGISGPTRMKVGPDGLLYVLQWSGNGLVKRYNLKGVLVDDFTSIGVSQSIGLVWDDQGFLYVSSYNGGFVRRFDENGIDLGVFINSNLSGPTNIEIDNEGNFLVFDWNNGRVQKFDYNGQFIETFIQGVGNCEGIEYMNGNIFIGVGSQGSVKSYTEEGEYIEDFVSPGSGGLMRPNALRFRVKETNLSDDEIIEFPIIYPSLGRLFYIRNSSLLTDVQVDVFDLEGKLVSEPKVKGDIIWNAKDFLSGQYLIRLKTKEGKSKTYPVIVK